MQEFGRFRCRTLVLCLASLTLSVSLAAQSQSPPNTPPNTTVAEGGAHPTPSSTKGDLPDSEPGHTHFLDFKNGFQGHKFGSSLDQFEGMKLITDLGREKIYAKKDEHIKLGEAEIDHVHYHFLDGKFRGVQIFTMGASNTDFLLQVLQTAFGEGAHLKGPFASIVWTGTVANCRFDENSTNDAQVWLGNNALDGEFAKYMREVALETAKQL
jgi:hypothetical protein